MLVSWGFKKSEGDFFAIGDKVCVIWNDSQSYDGILKDIRPDEGEIVVDNFVFDLLDINEIKHIN